MFNVHDNPKVIHIYRIKCRKLERQYIRIYRALTSRWFYTYDNVQQWKVAKHKRIYFHQKWKAVNLTKITAIDVIVYYTVSNSIGGKNYRLYNNEEESSIIQSVEYSYYFNWLWSTFIRITKYSDSVMHYHSLAL